MKQSWFSYLFIYLFSFVYLFYLFPYVQCSIERVIQYMYTYLVPQIRINHMMIQIDILNETLQLTKQFLL